MQDSEGFTSFHLDAGSTPLFCFGYGLTYTKFRYQNLRAPIAPIKIGESFEVSAELINIGEVEADEVAQLYVRDLVGSVTRPVKELKGFRRLRLKPDESNVVSFRIHTDELAFFGADMRRHIEPGQFQVWIGSDSNADLRADIELVK